MKWKSLILFAGALVLLGGGCSGTSGAQSSLTRAALPPPSPDPGCVADQTGKTFISDKVRMLQPGDFVFDDNGYTVTTAADGTKTTVYNPPPTNATLTNPVYAQQLMAAFSIAPRFLQKFICNQLNYVFVDQQLASPDAWSFWENGSPTVDPKVPQGSGSGRWIALSTRNWRFYSATSALAVPTFAEYETNKILDVLGGVDAAGYPRYAANPDSSALGLLAIMAQEVGHVVYYDQCQLPQTEPALCLSFRQSTWSSVGTPDRIYKRGDAFGGQKLADISVDIATVRSDFLANGATGSAFERVYGVGGGSPPINWTSLLSVTSPSKEFVELYELHVLRNATSPLTSLKIYFSPSQSTDIITTNLAPGTNLSNKEAIVDQLSQ